MYIEVTVEASRELVQYLLLVRRSVTFLALRNVLVLSVMAVGAVDLSMETGGLLPGVENLHVAGAAGNCRCGLVIGDLTRLVNRVALQTGIEPLSLVVGLVTVRAGRLIAMGGMTSLACHLAVLAGELDYLFLRAGMALATCVGEPGVHRHFFWSMRIGVAVSAIDDGLAMGLSMAGIAFGHYFIPIILFRVVAVEAGVALLALEPVLTTIGLQIAEDFLVALGALDGIQRGGGRRIQLLVDRDLDRGDLLPFRGGKGCGGYQKHQHGQHCVDPVYSHVVFPPWVI